MHSVWCPVARKLFILHCQVCGKSRIVGLSVGTFNYELGPVVLALQGIGCSHVTLADNEDDVEGSPDSFWPKNERHSVRCRLHHC